MNKFLLFALLALFAVAFAQTSDESPETSTDFDPTLPTDEPWWKKPLEKLEDLEPSQATKNKFVSWIKKYARKYHFSELETRFQLWKKTVKSVFEVNSKNSTWQAEVNQFAANSKEELKNFLGAVIKSDASNDTTPPPNIDKRFRPSWIDWGQRGAVTSVKNQGGCGSCWAFAAAGALEGGKAIAGKGRVDLSPQHIMNCGGLGACQGGDPHGAIRWGNSRIGSWGDVPYAGSQQGCRNVGAQTQCKGFMESRSGRDEDAANLIAGGPASICFAVIDQFFSYRGGVFSMNCPRGCNHAVVATGYAENCNNSGKNCYIVKNSWGSGWGTNGYFLIERGNNMCGIASYLGRPTNC